ncbi:MAG: nucleotidyltransferase [Mariprofundaceae bacterium]
MLAKDYQEMINEFSSFGVEFVVIGAYAMRMFGYTRATGDIDFFCKSH